MYYQFYEWNHAFLSPARAVNDAVRLYYRNPLNPFTHTEFGRQIAAAGDLFERMTRHYGKPEFGIEETEIGGRTVAVREEVVWERPFCRLLKFARDLPPDAPQQPNLILVAPMSGHYATLLRGTVQALLPHNNVYITDWADARKVPLTVGRFDLDDFIDYIIDIIHHFEGDAHLVAVCQPAVPVFAATAIMERRRSGILPKSITLMGGPIDTRQNPTEVNTYAENHNLEWFRRNVIMPVPFPHPGVMRKVYPGFLQLSGFMTMNLDRHLTAHYDYFDNLVKGDGDSADKHRDFYDEYLSVMDLTAEFYLQTVNTVFLRHALPKGEMTHRGEAVDPAAITRTPILTVEGEMDDISGLGQTKAAHTLAVNLPDERHRHYEQANVGHYGVFNGSRFRNEIAPRICEFVAEWDSGARSLTFVAETAAHAIAATEEAARHIAEAADTLNDLATEAEPAAPPTTSETIDEPVSAAPESQEPEAPVPVEPEVAAATGETVEEETAIEAAPTPDEMEALAASPDAQDEPVTQSAAPTPEPVDAADEPTGATAESLEAQTVAAGTPSEPEPTAEPDTAAVAAEAATAEEPLGSEVAEAKPVAGAANEAAAPETGDTPDAPSKRSGSSNKRVTQATAATASEPRMRRRRRVGTPPPTKAEAELAATAAPRTKAPARTTVTSVSKAAPKAIPAKAKPTATVAKPKATAKPKHSSAKPAKTTETASATSPAKKTSRPRRPVKASTRGETGKPDTD